MRMRTMAGWLIALAAGAQSPGQTPLGSGFTFQGQLRQNGAPLSGTVNLVFSLWDAAGSGSPPSGGSQVGSAQTILAVQVSDGLFTVALNGSGEFGASAFNGNKRWLQASVNGTTLAPRQELTATPHALFALNADRLDGLNSTAFLQAIPVPLTLSGTSATQIIRADNASALGGATGIVGSATAAAGFTYGGRFDNSSTSGTGAFGRALAVSGTTYGVYGHSNSTSGTGVAGSVSAASGTTYGVYGASASTSGRGVYGAATASSGSTTGVYGHSASSQGRGVTGIGGATGVYGESTNVGPGAGVYGYVSGGTPLGDAGIAPISGVRGRSDAIGGLGVFGEDNAATGMSYGMYGQSNSASGTGVYGEAFATSGTTYGVYGRSGSPAGYGVFGRKPAGGYAVYASGDLGASGVKSFRIDHPDDPANKYLLHYCAESPDVINFYSGNATLDAAGEAVVALPHYFAKLNKDPRYVLTAVGAPMPMLHVAEKISAAALATGADAAAAETAPVCRFRIAGGAPNGEVSWEVKVVRNDPWVRRYGAPVESEKEERGRGTYQHPELYGQPPEMGMHHAAGASATARSSNPNSSTRIGITASPARMTSPIATAP